MRLITLDFETYFANDYTTHKLFSMIKYVIFGA